MPSMAAPRPLTLTPPAKLDWSRPETPVAMEFGDIYFSTDGGLDESRTVFLRGCGLPEGWANRSLYTVAELGFGSGLNFLTTWQSWAKTAKAHQRLHYVSIEKFPFDANQLTQALKAWPELQNFSQKLIAQWPGRVKGIHRLNFGAVTLTLIHDDVIPALERADNLKANAWFLDGFSPSSNPAMWSAEVMRSLAACCASGARLATFSVAGAVRSSLTKAGFSVRKMPGFGRKRHRLEAEYSGGKSAQITPIEKALIVGAGIAGRSLAKALSARQIAFDIIDNRSHPSASGNPAALVKPRFDLQDRPESRFFLSAYLQALRTYPDAAILARGVKQLPTSEKEIDRFRKLIDQAPLGQSHLIWKDIALWIDSALVINPSKTSQDFDVRRETYRAAQNTSDYSHLFLAAGYGINDIAPDLEFRFSRGQLSWAKPIWDLPTAYGGYALNLDGAALIGATHDRLDERDPFELRPEDDQRNLSALADISGCKIEPVDLASRASVRVTSRDTLPILAKLDDSNSASCWTLSGLGSRGFTFAPLLAEALIAHICDEIGPLEKQLRAKFSEPARYK